MIDILYVKYFQYKLKLPISINSYIYSMFISAKCHIYYVKSSINN